MSEPDAKGLLLAMMEPPPAMEEEFHEWYDTEHFPERAGTEGFLTANRFVCVEGWPRYLALYDLADISVLRSEGYARIAGDNYSIWTGRIIPRVWGQYRAEGVQIHPCHGLFGEAGRSSRTVIWRFRDVPDALSGKVVDGLRKIYEGRPETAQLRVFRCAKDGGTDYVGIVELHAPLAFDPGAIEACGAARRHLDLVNSYARYQRA